MELEGELIFVRNVEQVNDKFSKREFIIKTDEQYPQEISIQLTNSKCDLIDKFPVGKIIKVHFNMRGKGYVNAAGEKRRFNAIDAWKIEFSSLNSGVNN